MWLCQQMRTFSAHFETRLAMELHPDVLLNRRDAADALTRAGFRVSSATLATKASRGGGPRFRLFGRVPLYRWDDLIAWAEGRMSEPGRGKNRAPAEAQIAAP
jgi:hypothetical protein